MVGLGDLPGGSFNSVAYGVSADGSVVVGMASPDPIMRKFEAFRWTSGGGMVGLGDLPDGNLGSFATAVSGDGGVVVGQGNSSDGPEAFRWTSGGGMVGLGDLPHGVFWSIAYATNSDGSIVVGSASTAVGTEAFIWDSGTGMRNLREVLVNDFDYPLTGWSLTAATGVSADGLVIVGYGINPQGKVEAWVAYMSPFVDGDFNLDGMVNGGDLALFTAALLFGSNFPFHLEHGDFNHNGVVDNGDVPCMSELLMGP
jgi:probable HAF family extracellular repeat protein